jgi:hypothetical protein
MPSDLPSDLPIFLGSIALFILYLVFSALTEMGTKLPWKNSQDEHDP